MVNSCNLVFLDKFVSELIYLMNINESLLPFR